MKENDTVNDEFTITKPFESIPVNFVIKPIGEIDETKSNILLIEDNRDLVALMQDNLKEKYNFFFALNGIEALNLLDTIPKPDIIISDIMMDKMNGYEFYEKLQLIEEYKAIPLIFLTAKTTEKDKALGLSKGAIDYIFKPFSINELIFKIESLLKLQSMLGEVKLNEMKNRIYRALENDDSNKKQIDFDKKCANFKLSFREKQIIQSLIKGKTYKDIGVKYNLAEGTINTHITHTYNSHI